MEIINGNQNAIAAITALHVGKVQSLLHGEKEVPSAIYKSLSLSKHKVSKLGVEGDEQGDTVNHGGLDKAICVYLEQSYAQWDRLGRKLEHGAFGENITWSKQTEEDINIGDIYQIGSIVAQVSQPRQPCFKLGIRNDWPELVKLSRETGYTGFYLRVLEEGTIASGVGISLLQRAEHSLSIKEANEIMYSPHNSIERYQQLANIPELAEAWKLQLNKKINKLMKA